MNHEHMNQSRLDSRLRPKILPLRCPKYPNIFGDRKCSSKNNNPASYKEISKLIRSRTEVEFPKPVAEMWPERVVGWLSSLLVALWKYDMGKSAAFVQVVGVNRSTGQPCRLRLENSSSVWLLQHSAADSYAPLTKFTTPGRCRLSTDTDTLWGYKDPAGSCQRSIGSI